MHDKFKYSEIAEELMNSMRKTYKTNIDSANNECPKSERAISYAFGELEDSQKFRDHLKACHYCLDLVLDIHEAESEPQTHSRKAVEMLPAFSDAIGYSKRFSFLKKIPLLISKQINFFISPKFIVPLATACLLVVIYAISFNNPKPFEPYTETVKKIRPLKKGIIHPSYPAQGVKPISEPGNETPSIHLITPKDQGKKDPFTPQIGDTADSVARQIKRKKHRHRSPLEGFALSQLKLVAIIIASKGNIALIEDSSGKGYLVEKGTYVGLNSGKVIQVMEDKIIIEEKIEDISGKFTPQRRELRLQGHIKSFPPENNIQ